MSDRRRRRGKGWPIDGRFVALPLKVLQSQAYIGLSAIACRLLVDLALQFNGNNNGDFTLAWKVMSARGWTSKATVERARDELISAGFVLLTRQGGRHRSSLYAVTWLPIHECGGKLDVAPTDRPPHDWKSLYSPARPRAAAEQAISVPSP